MKGIKGIVLGAGLCLGMVACGSHDGNDHSMHNGQQGADPLDSIRGLVMAAHDVAMPKMGKLKGYQDLLSVKIDSLKQAKADAAVIAQFEGLKTMLADAEKGMNDWMDAFEYEPEMSADSARVYMLDQQAKAEKMSKAILASLDSAQVVLGQ